MKTGAAGPDIRALSRQQVISAIQEIKNQWKSSKFVMVLDQASTPVIAGLFKMTELMEYNIVLLERYDLKRQPLPAYHAIYFLSPKTSLDVLISDFSGSKPMYAAPHVLFTYPCDNSILKPLESAPAVVDRILTFKFLFLQFTSTDATTFYTNTSNAFQTMYDSAKRETQFTAAAEHMVAGLTSFFFNIKTQPEVAFISDSNDLTQVVASKFNCVMEDTLKTLPPDQQKGINKNSLLLIFGRGSDPAAPLLHSLNYESELYDYFRPENNVITPVPDRSDETIILSSYDDDRYTEFRYCDPTELGECGQKLTRNLADLQVDDSASLKERMEKNRKLGNRLQERKRDNAHLNAIDVIVNQRKKRNIQDIVPFEQCLATGFQFQKDSVFKPEGSELSQRLNQATDKNDKIRLLALFQLGTKRIKDEQGLLRMMQVGAIEPEWKKAFENVSKLMPEEEKKRIPRDLKRPKNEDAQWDRYIPLMYEVVKTVYENKKLPKGMEQYLALPQHSGRYQSITVFMMGGISPMELRWLGNLRKEMRGVKLYVGSSNILSARSYLAQLKTMSG